MPRYEQITDFDREIWRKELEDFVPAKVCAGGVHGKYVTWGKGGSI